MPLYEYECVKCGRRTEKIENVSGPHLKKCPHCGGAVEALISAPAIQFKGSGWYVTDYAAKSAKSEGNKDEKPTTEKKEGSGESASKENQSKQTEAKETRAKETSTKETTKEKKTDKAGKNK